MLHGDKSVQGQHLTLNDGHVMRWVTVDIGQGAGAGCCQSLICLRNCACTPGLRGIQLQMASRHFQGAEGTPWKEDFLGRMYSLEGCMTYLMKRRLYQHKHRRKMVAGAAFVALALVVTAMAQNLAPAASPEEVALEMQQQAQVAKFTLAGQNLNSNEDPLPNLPAFPCVSTGGRLHRPSHLIFYGMGLMGCQEHPVGLWGATGG